MNEKVPLLRRRWPFLLLLGIALAPLAYTAAGHLRNFLHRGDRLKVRATISVLFQVERVMQAYHRENKGYPRSPEAFEAACAEGDVPFRDGWGHHLRYRARHPLREFAAGYEASSPGRDGVFQGPTGAPDSSGVRTAPYFDCDIIMTDNWFLQIPHGFGKS